MRRSAARTWVPLADPRPVVGALRRPWSRLVRRGGWIGLAALAVLGFLIGWLLDVRLPQSRLEPLAIVSRSQWGADNPDPRLRLDQESEVFNTVVVHHSAMAPDAGPREIQYAHMRERGFLDIGYHFVIDRRGRIYEGRNLVAHGAHVRDHNAGTLGIALLGNYEELQPSPEQTARLKALIRVLMERYPLTHLAGHGDFLPGKTLCPGKNLAPLLPGLAAELGLRFGAGGYIGPEPAPDAPTPPSGADAGSATQG